MFFIFKEMQIHTNKICGIGSSFMEQNDASLCCSLPFGRDKMNDSRTPKQSCK